MFYKKLLFFVLIVLCIDGYAQRKDAHDVMDVTKISFAAPAISFEKRIGTLQTLYAQAFASINFGIGYSESLGNTSFINVDPAAGIQYRYYYNAAKRERKGKRTEMNSMNYIAPSYTMLFSSWSISDKYYGEEKRRPVHTLAIVWGMQRNYSRRFSIDLNAGPAVNVAKTTLYDYNMQPLSTKTAAAFTIQVQARIGIWLNSMN